MIAVMSPEQKQVTLDRMSPEERATVATDMTPEELDYASGGAGLGGKSLMPVSLWWAFLATGAPPA